MKNTFESRISQGDNIRKYIKRNCNFKMECQYCGKRGELHNNYTGNPYEIQIICRNCKVAHKVKSDKMQNDIPLIKIREHIIPTSKSKVIILDDYLLEKINVLLNSTDYNKNQALKYLNISPVSFKKLLEDYRIIYDKDISDKLNTNFKLAISKKFSQVKTTGTYCNNLYKIKLEKGLSNRQLFKVIKETGGKVPLPSITNIAIGKYKPKYKTKFDLAVALGVSIADIFPEDEYFRRIKNYNQYLQRNKELRENYIKFLKDSNTYNTRIGKLIGINDGRLYDFIKGTNLSSKDFKLLEEYINGKR